MIMAESIDDMKEDLPIVNVISNSIDNDNNDDYLKKLSHEQLVNLCKANRLEMLKMKNDFEIRYKQQQLESIRKENILIMRLTLKEQELQDSLTQVEALRNGIQSSTLNSMHALLLDPALNLIIERMKKEVDDAKLRAEQANQEMMAWKFSPDSISGKQLMSKCRLLHQENEELGKMISSGRIAKLESKKAMYKHSAESLKKSQLELEKLLNDIEENQEGSVNTIYRYQQQLEEYENRFRRMEKDLIHSKLNDNNACNDEKQ